METLKKAFIITLLTIILSGFYSYFILNYELSSLTREDSSSSFSTQQSVQQYKLSRERFFMLNNIISTIFVFSISWGILIWINEDKLDVKRIEEKKAKEKEKDSYASRAIALKNKKKLSSEKANKVYRNSNSSNINNSVAHQSQPQPTHTPLIVNSQYPYQIVSTLNNNNIYSFNPSDLTVFILDVGQSDAIFITHNNRWLIVDGGEESDREYVMSVIDILGIKNIDYVICSHLDSDHLGSLDHIINRCNVGIVFMSERERDTVQFRQLKESIDASGSVVHMIEYDNDKDEVCKMISQGKEFKLGGNNVDNRNNNGNNNTPSFKFLAPLGKDYADFNEFSIVTSLRFGESSILLTGDAEKISESEMMNNDKVREALKNHKALKCGHHGSRNSTGEEFLNVVNPDVLLMSVGEDNKYGHPHQELLERINKFMNNKRIENNLYRTDKNGLIKLSMKVDGSIVVYTDR